MTNEYRQVKCPHCEQQLRLTVSEKNFGREVEVTCTTCNRLFSTTISYPAGTHEETLHRVKEHLMSKFNSDDLRRIRPLMKEFHEALNDALSNSPRLEGVVEKIREAGYDPLLVLEGTVSFNKHGDLGSPESEIHEPAQLVRDGKIVPGTRTDGDYAFTRSMKIDTNEN